jgi:hypothetical protein
MRHALWEQWTAAQQKELRYHLDTVPSWGANASPAARRVEEDAKRRWYAGMLRIPLGDHDPNGPTVTDFGCGPDSLILSAKVNRSQSVAIDPLQFPEAIEDAYAKDHVRRRQVPGEQYVGGQTDEVWMYNCLQHTMDPMRVLDNACAHARETLRVFEWTDTPTSDVHLHTLTESDIRATVDLAGFRKVLYIVGIYSKGATAYQQFFAGIWRRAI